MLGPSFRSELGADTAYQRGHPWPFSLKLHSTSTTLNPPGPALFFCTVVITIWHTMYHLSILFHLTELYKSSIRGTETWFTAVAAASTYICWMNEWTSCFQVRNRFLQFNRSQNSDYFLYFNVCPNDYKMTWAATTGGKVGSITV